MFSPTVEPLATSGLRLLETQSPWYCGRVAPGRERAFERGLHRFEIPTYFPVHKKQISRKQYNWRTQENDVKPYTREMALFPGYVFVALEEGEWSLIRERQSYRPSWLMIDGRPVQFPVELIQDIQARETNGFVRLETEFVAGEELEITDGVWRGHRGLLASDPDRRTLTLHMIAESYALNPSQVLTRLKIDREYVRRIG